MVLEYKAILENITHLSPSVLLRVRSTSNNTDGNKRVIFFLYNTNSSSASPLTIVLNYSHMCPAYTSRGYYSRAAFISLRASDCAATIRGRRVFEEIPYCVLQVTGESLATSMTNHACHV